MHRTYNHYFIESLVSMEIVKISKDSYIYISLKAPAKFRSDSCFLQKSRSDLDNITQVLGYGNTVMPISAHTNTHYRVLITLLLFVFK